MPFGDPFRDPTPGEASAQVHRKRDGSLELLLSVPSAQDAIPIMAICTKCGAPVHTGLTINRGDLPLTISGRWRCSCRGVAVLPDHTSVRDYTTGEVIDLRSPQRRQATVSAITLAELLRLSQAARAVQAGRPGADEKLERVLAEAPEPIRRLRDRFSLQGWTRDQKLMLAGIIVALAAALMPMLKDDGAVTEHQLVEIIERLVDQQSEAPGQQGQPEDDRAGSAGGASTEERGAPTDALDGGGGGSAPEVQHDQGVGDPDQ